MQSDAPETTEDEIEARRRFEAGVPMPVAPTPDPDRISMAHKIATLLWDAGVRGPDGLTILGMAMGIYMEAQEGAHRNMRPLSEALLKSAQMTFDAFREGKQRQPGSA